MKKTIGYLIFAFIIIGCANKDCPGYPEELLKWMPYSKGENLIFISGVDSLKLKVSETFRSSPHSAQSIYFNKYCRIEASITILNDSESQIISQRSIYSEDTGQATFDLDLFNFTSYATFQIKNGVITTGLGQLPATLLNSYNNGFKDYDNVLVIDVDTLNYRLSSVYQIYIAESIGVIQIKERKNYITWCLIEE